MKAPLVSIIIPTYNRANLIGETLGSVLTQTYTNWECIIVDDGSTDHTDEVVENYLKKDIRFIYIKKRLNQFAKGAGAARNYGLEYSQGEYINWFDSDDLMESNFISEKIKILTLYPDTDVVIGGFGYFDVNGTQNRYSNLNFSGNILEDLLNNRINFCPQTFLIKKEKLNNFKFSTKLTRNEDLDFFFDFFVINERLIINQVFAKILFFVRKHPKSVSAYNDIDGNQIKSAYIVHKKIMSYFKMQNNQTGFRKYAKAMLADLKTLLEYGQYIFVIKEIIKADYLVLSSKVIIIYYIVIYFFTRRGILKFKNVAIKKI